MPGLSSDRVGVQVAPIAAIGADNPTTPAVGDFMQAFRNGFLTVDDLTRRGVALPAQLAASQQDLADQIQIRPLSRQQQIGALGQQIAIQPKQTANAIAAEDLKGKQIDFAAESLPILDDTKREQFKQDYQNVLQHGLPNAVDNLFNQVVPQFLPIDQTKLVSKEGVVNTAYKLELIGKAIAKAEELKTNAKFTGPVKQTVVQPTGASKETTTVMNQISGKAVGVPITTEEKAAQTGKNVVDIKSERVNTTTGTKEFTVQRFDKDTGQLLGSPEVVGSEPLKLTQEQANALQFSDRMGFNNQIVDSLATNGFDPTAFKNTLQSFLPNRIRPEALQSYTAAKDNWITAALRKESGAAISASEYTMANKEYFPRDGDSPAIVNQKAALRQLAEEDIRLNSPIGGFWNPGGGRRTPTGNPITPTSHVTGATSVSESYGNRQDGTPKGAGYFGELKRPDGKISTELSIGVNFDGKEQQIPSLVPTLNTEEVNSLLKGEKPSRVIVDKAVAFARQRIAQGKSPFATSGEQVSPPSGITVSTSGALAAPAASANIPSVSTPEEASALPASVQFFRIPSGAVKINPNYRP